MKTLIDASSVIYAWENYPIEIFPHLWTWLEEDQMAENLVGMIRENLDEVEKMSPECFQWLKYGSISVISGSDEAIQEEKRLADELGIKDDKYGKGVDYNDLLLIATASVNKYDVMTNEALQGEEPKNKANYKIPKNKANKIPPKKANYKIPLVCRTITQPKITTYSFIEWLKYQDPTF